MDEPKTVSLRALDALLSDAAKIVNRALASDEDEPEIDFEDLRRPLRTAIGLLDGTAEDDVDHREDWAPGARGVEAREREAIYRQARDSALVGFDAKTSRGRKNLATLRKRMERAELTDLDRVFKGK